jgi:hypothetical protein
MLRRATRFLRRHRRAIILGAVTGAVAAGVVHARRGLNRAMAALHEAENRILEEHRRQHHLARIRRECDEALLRFIASLSSSLNSHFSEETSLVHRLKALRQSGCSDSSKQQELWTELKVMAFTHFMVGYYSFNLLHMVIRIQMHILGRYNFLRTSNTSFAEEGSATDAESSPFSREVRGEFLSLTYNYLLGDGLRSLAETLTPIVAEVLADCDHTKRLDCSTVLALLRHMREKFDDSGAGYRVPSPLVNYVMLPDHTLKTACPAAQEMLNETWDVVESPHFAEAMGSVLDKSLGVLADQLSRNVFVHAPKKTEDEGRSSNAPASKPVASLLMQLKPSKTVLVVEGDQPLHAEATRQLPAVCNLCEAVFDSEHASEE